MPIHILADGSLTLAMREGKIRTDLIDHLIPNPVLLEKVSFVCDVACDADELMYLTDWREGAIITASSCMQALWHLQQKNKFETIRLDIMNGIAGVYLRVELESFWTLAQLKFKGHVVERDKYRQYYTIEPTERFEQHIHQRCLEHIQQALFNQGYGNAQVSSVLKQDVTTKSIAATITIDPQQKFRIGKIVVQLTPHEGVSAEDLKLIKECCVNNFVSRIGHRVYSKSALNKHTLFLRRKLIQNGFFHTEITLQEQINQSSQTVDVVFSLDVYPKRTFVFLGVHYFSSAYLLDQIMLFGSCAHELAGAVLAQELQGVYKQHGFLSACIEVEQDEHQLIFIVNEGARTVIKDIVITGVDYVTCAYLVGQFFSKVIAKGYYSQRLVDQAVQQMILWYNDQGFVSAKVTGVRVEKKDNGKEYLKVEVEEGKRSVIASITCNAFLEDIEAACVGNNVAKGAPFTLSALEGQRACIEKEAKKRGLNLQEIKPTVYENQNGVGIDWQVKAIGSDHVFGKTIIIDCPDFPHHYLLRELTYQQGDPYDPKKLRESVAQLKDLDIFETIRLYPAPFEQGNERPILLKVHKDDPYEVRLRGGLGLQQMSTQFTFRSLTYVAGGVFKVKNPFNRADQFKCEADYKRGMHSLLASYKCPWIGQYPIAMNVDAYATQYLQPGWIETQHNLYSLSQMGFLMGFNHKKPRYSIGFDTGFEWMETRTTGVPDSPFFNYSLARALNFVPALLDHKIPYFVVEPALMLDLTDSKINPTKGTFTLLTMKSMIPMAFLPVSSYFVKLFLQHSIYIPFHPLQFLIGLRIGHIFQKDFSSIMPSERFYLGGANSIRSYQTDSCPPLGIFADDDGKKVFIPQGAKSMANLNLEARFPVYKDVGLALFQDLGVLHNTRFTQIKRESVLAGSGFGLRYATPIGPLRFDIAWKWAREDPEISRFAWYITFGSVF